MILKGLEGEQPSKKKGKSHFELIWSIKYITAEYSKRKVF